MRVAGADAEKLLQGIITNDMDLLASQPALHAALLTPQGKILFEFFVVKAGDGFLLETARDRAADLAKRLTCTSCAPRSTSRMPATTTACSRCGATLPHSPGETTGTVSFADPRLPALGLRILAEAKFAADIAAATNGEEATAEDYHAHRIALGVPEGGKDYALGDTFPHEADLDQLNGVSFTKGCFVGQEVVSRMQHRGTVRKRVVPIEGDGAARLRAPRSRPARPPSARSARSPARQALALLRLDRAAEAKAKGQALTAGGVAITLRKPDWATFDLEPAAAAETP